MNVVGGSLSLPLTFFTLCGFFSLRHLRMSISVVLTQPGCGRQQQTKHVSGSDKTVSPACIVYTCAAHTIRCWCSIEQRHTHKRLLCKLTGTKSDCATNNTTRLSAGQYVELNLLFSVFKC